MESINRSKILVVDDSKVNLIVLRGLLQSYSADILTALSGKEARQLLLKEVVDLIFLDKLMPEESGIECYKKIKELPNDNSKTPVYLTSATEEDDIKELGFEGFLKKPVEPEALSAILEKYGIKKAVDKIFNDKKADLPKIEGINTGKGLDNAGMNGKIYIKILETFGESSKQAIRDLRYYIKTDDMENYIIKVHALKSSAWNIGAMELGNEFERHETAGSNEDYHYIKVNYEHLEHMLMEVSKEINKYFENRKEAQKDTKKEIKKIKEVKEGFVENQVKDCLQYIEDFEDEAAAKVMVNLLQYNLDISTKEKCRQALGFIKQFDYDAAAAILTGLYKTGENVLL
ncbi:Response regulator receiver domain-containing protein [Acetitomaculum ruminis DSM 5522]|uniref:Stage 0 sporulation protein A homolog n=1 Tax=Acetitomaculum ruminis DSM 5522 TaxID=1120918 RepID=A0A1I0YJ89_9FIRM|nr:response regulator [Acetitomaculum ruminis]SFB13429.1 Response regulator receiver domain-containing protein [Acetitomaculum ruminis DSM 5522]